VREVATIERGNSGPVSVRRAKGTHSLMLATALEAIAPHRLAAELGRSATCAG